MGGEGRCEGVLRMRRKRTKSNRRPSVEIKMDRLKRRT